MKTFLISALLIFSPTVFGMTHDGASCRTSVEEAGTRDSSQLTKRWDAELISDYESGNVDSLKEKLAQSWSKTPDRSRKRAREYFFRTRQTIEGQLAEMQSSIKSDAGDSLTPADLLSRIQSAIHEQHIKDTFTDQIAGKDFKTYGRATVEGLEKTGASDVEFKYIRDGLKEYENAIGRYKQKYGEEFFPDDTTLKSGFDVFAMMMLGKLSGSSPESAEAIYSLSLLHPITDNALDSHRYDVGATMGKITKILAGETIAPDNAYERVVFDLIKNILKAFPHEKDPLVRDTLASLHEAQLKSVAIQKSRNQEAVLENTLRKGALTYLLFARLGLGPLKIDTQKYFYRAGAILQLIDDLLDVKTDLEEGKATPWTLAYQDHSGNLEGPFLRMMSLHADLSQDSSALLQGLPHAQKIDQSFDFAVKLFIYSASMDPFTYQGLQTVINKRLPMDPDAMRIVSYSLLEQMQDSPGDEQTLLRVLDMGFFNGAYRNGTLAPEAKKTLDALAAKWSARWWFIRNSQKLQDSFTKLWVNQANGERNPVLSLLTLAVVSGHLYLVTENLRYSPYSGLMIPAYFLLYKTTKWRRPFTSLGLGGAMLGLSYLIPHFFH